MTFICAFALAFSIASFAVSMLCLNLLLSLKQEPAKAEQKPAEETEETDAERRAKEEMGKFYVGLSNLLSYNGTPQPKEGDE